MPVKNNAKKEIRKSEKRTAKNKIIKVSAKTLIKKTRKAIDANGGETLELLKKSVKALDKAAKQGVIKKGTAARKKSRLMKRMNKATTQEKK